MKFQIGTKTLSNAVNEIKQATALSKQADRSLFLEVIDDLLILKSSGANVFAETNLGVTDGENGKAVVSFESMNAFKFAKDGQELFELEGNGFKIDGPIKNGWIPTKEAELLFDPTPPEEFTLVGKEVFNILYAIDGRDPQLNAVFVDNTMFACTNRHSYAGYNNKVKVTDEPKAIHPNLLASVPKREFGIAFEDTFVWINSDGLCVGMPTLVVENDTVFDYAFHDVDATRYVEITLKDAGAIANLIHALSSSELHEGNDGRGSFRLQGGRVYAIAKKTNRGSGETEPIKPLYYEGEFRFGLSTKLFKNAISNIDSDHRVADIYCTNIDEYQVLILRGERTSHFIAEDPTAR